MHFIRFNDRQYFKYLAFDSVSLNYDGPQMNMLAEIAAFLVNTDWVPERRFLFFVPLSLRNCMQPGYLDDIFLANKLQELSNVNKRWWMHFIVHSKTNKIDTIFLN